MCKTEHTVKVPVYQAHRVSVSHEDYEAIQYEFYISEEIWDHSSVQTFLERLESIESGATIFAGLVGVWQGEPEQSRIYRKIIRAGQFDLANARAAFHSEIGRLMADLSASAESAQDTFMLTETDIRVTKSSGLTRI